MTDQLFSVQQASEAPPLQPAERFGRWVLHRAGIVNVWQYDRAEILFAGGRALLRGRNGAGKSKALEVLLPFLLEGDVRSIDAAGRDRTSVYWLMTDGRDQGNHVGYVWLELRNTDEDGADRFLTLGAGLKASTSTRTHTSWFFMTDAVRVGVDLHLGPDVSSDRLREMLGTDAVTTAAEHRRRVGLRLFGLHDETRYSNLLRLMHRLRDPNIGNRIEAGDLASILRDSLPPPADDALAMAAERFDSLDQIREQLARAQKTSNALGRFLETYSGYARTVLRDRAQAVMDADDRRRRESRELKRLERESAEAGEALVAATSEVARLHDAERTAVRELEGLKSSEAYKEHQNLVDRRRVVDTLDAAAGQAESHADHLAALAGEESAEAARVAALAEESEQAVRARRPALVVLAQGAGVDPLVVPTDDPDAIPTAVAVAVGRRRAAEQVRELIRIADAARDEARAADEQAARSEGELQERREEAEVARQAWVAASLDWRARVRAWAEADLHLPEGPGLDPGPLTGVLGEGAAGDDELTAVRQKAADVVAPAHRAAREAEAAAGAAAVEARRALAEKEAERAALEAAEEARPPRSRFQAAERDPEAGAAFYELVEVSGSAGLSTAEQAGLEAALEASGLLDAWVADDGLVLHPSTRDVILRAGGEPLPEGVPTLAGVLAPARPNLIPALRSIGWGDPGPDATHPWVSPDGRWSLGLLRGAWSKDGAEYLGAGTRRDTRLRQLAELTTQCAQLADALEAAQVTASRWQNAVAVLDGHLRDFPAERPVVEARSEHEARSRVQAGAASRHDADRRRAEEARTVAARARADLGHTAGRDSLPETPDLISDVIDAARRLADDLTAWHEQWKQAAVRRADSDRLAGRAAARQVSADQARADAARARQRHREEAAGLAALEEAIGSTVDEVLAAIQEWTRRAETARDAQPAAEEAARDAASADGRLREAVTAAQDRAVRCDEEVVEAGRRLRRALELPGVVTAALGASEESRENDADDAALARQLRQGVGAGETVSDQVVLNRLRDLEAGLAGGYDVVAGEDDGVKYFHVVDDTGRQPLPSVAARVAEEAAAASRRLNASEQEVIQKFLLGELGEELRERLLEAHDLVASANQALSGQRTSHGIGAHLDWRIDPEAEANARTAAEMLLKRPRTHEEDAQLRDALMEMIRAERERDPALGYIEHLRAALDYRHWYRFAIQVVDDSKPGTKRALHSRIGLSQGEQRVVSYLALFSAAAAYYEGIGSGCPRLLLLDDAFAKVDEPTHGRLLKLLVDLDLDFLITSERMWGCFREVPSLEIYEALREPSVPGVALVHFRWDGHDRHLVGL